MSQRVRPYARGRIRVSGQRNKLESAYELVLRARQIAGEVAWFKYEGLTLKLAPDTRYTPDFAVMLADGSLEMHETKGFMREDALVKIKLAAELFPFRFFLVKRDRDGWDVKEY